MMRKKIRSLLLSVAIATSLLQLNAVEQPSPLNAVEKPSTQTWSNAAYSAYKQFLSGINSANNYAPAGKFDPEADPFSFNNQYNDEINMIEKAKKRDNELRDNELLLQTHDAYRQAQQNTPLDSIIKDTRSYAESDAIYAERLSSKISMLYLYQPLVGHVPSDATIAALRYWKSKKTDDKERFHDIYKKLSSQEIKDFNTIRKGLNRKGIEYPQKAVERLAESLQGELLRGKSRFSEQELLNIGLDEKMAKNTIRLARTYRNLAREVSAADAIQQGTFGNEQLEGLKKITQEGDALPGEVGPLIEAGNNYRKIAERVLRNP